MNTKEELDSGYNRGFEDGVSCYISCIISTLKLTINTNYLGIYCVYNDNYDGAEDAGRNLIGEGTTEALAILDYLSNIEEYYNE